jgi:glycosyltransferase involved in cell wall biosynthesis
MPKVSVIMPAYNAELFLETAIDSVLSQSFQDWELIVIDDGSSDSTANILEKYENYKLRIIHQENSGEACARNVGLENAQGEYIAFLDADDFYYPNALEDLVCFLDNHREYDVAYSDGTICDHMGKTLMLLSDIRPTLHSGHMLESLVLSSYMVTCCTMTRLSRIQQHAIRFDKNLAIGPDWDFWIQLAVHVSFGYLPTVTGGYRVHKSNITRTVDTMKRKRDRIFGRLKVMNSYWFSGLSVGARQSFFLDLLTTTLAGDIEGQYNILLNEQFAELPAKARADLWRLVGIDVLKNTRNSGQARSFLLESQILDQYDRKTKFLLWTLGLGSLPALAFVELWRLLLLLGKKAASVRNSHSENLQKLLGAK